jgi:hypothetical protein
VKSPVPEIISLVDGSSELILIENISLLYYDVFNKSLRKGISDPSEFLHEISMQIVTLSLSSVDD